MGTSAARIYRTIYIVIYGPVRTLVLDVNFFPFYDLFCIQTPKLAIPPLPRALALALYFSFGYTALLVATYAILCFFLPVRS